jgi:hypothetical protein
MIRSDLLQVGDVGGTTSRDFAAIAIKAKIWGWMSILNPYKCNHSFTVVRVPEDTVGTGRVLFKAGSLCIAEMGADGVDLMPFDEYRTDYKGDHYVFIGRHLFFRDNPPAQDMYSKFILDLRARHIKYGWEDILREEKWIDPMIKDNPNTLICNQLPREGFKRLGIPYPEQFNTAQFSPRDWQEWDDLTHIDSAVFA